VTGTLGRLLARRDFLRVAGERRKWVAPGLILQVAPTGLPDDDACRRVGFTASKKVGGAVVRNRAKRRLREAARAVMTTHARPGFDYVIIARGTTPSRPYRSLLADLEAGLRRLKAWRDDGEGAPGDRA
jgi:ribonuclease P protein component